MNRDGLLKEKYKLNPNSHLIGWQKNLNIFLHPLLLRLWGNRHCSSSWCYLIPFRRRRIWWDQPKVLLFCFLVSIQWICSPDSACTFTQWLTHKVIYCVHNNKRLETTQVFIIGAGWLNYLVQPYNDILCGCSKGQSLCA